MILLLNLFKIHAFLLFCIKFTLAYNLPAKIHFFEIKSKQQDYVCLLYINICVFACNLQYKLEEK
jgi:hypothetical protein